MDSGSRPRPIEPSWAAELARLIASAPVNLVSRADRGDVQGIHLDEAIAVTRHLHVRDGDRWMDLGTGGGLPGLVLAAAYPQTSWTLVDARSKKIELVRHFADVLDLPNVQALHARAEDLAASGHIGIYNGVVSRAAGSLAATVVLARPFITRGTVIAIRGPRAREDVDACATICADLGLVVDAVEEIGGTIRPTWLVRLRGQGPVPADFPRTQRALLRATRGGSSDGSA
ncbi:MAG TPA: RsmG family class I SAM-dependent methyltransferase [Euzebyales bacterium]|nr:RsmG family class I SAM-dependent methyltransferase [Euzebyales bacterium]